MNRLFFKSLVALSVCVALTIGCQKKALAGDREWATVGKILTGVLGVCVVQDVISDSRPYYNPYYCQSPVYYRSCNVIVVKDNYRRPSYHSNHRKHYRPVQRADRHSRRRY